MSSLLQIASRVEAAVASYVSVREFADTEKWKQKFREEFDNLVREYKPFVSLAAAHRPPLHPTLAALSMVLHLKGDLGTIGRTYTHRHKHIYFKADAVFPSDISDLLPQSADRWWEHLEAADRDRASQTISSQAPILKPKKVTLLPPRPAQPVVGPVDEDEEEDELDELEEEGGGDEPMSVDEGLESSVAEETSSKRKRKGSSAALGGTAKRRNQSTKRPGPAEERPSESNTDHEFACSRCKSAGEVCVVSPTGPCQRCKVRKQKCDLMPINPKTGKTDRHPPTKETLLEFRTKQAEERATGVKKGKQRARGSPDADEPDASKSVPSPLTTLVGLGGLSLESGGSSAADTPAESPTTLPPFPESPALAPSTASGSRARRASRRAARFGVEVPNRSQLLTPDAVSPQVPSRAQLLTPDAVSPQVPSRAQLLAPDAVSPQVSRSHSDASLASNDGNIAARLKILEDWSRGVDEKLKRLGV